VSRLTWVWFSLHGTLPFKLFELHKQYGPVIRIAPDELSYATSQAWKDVFQHRAGHEEFSKDPMNSARPVNGIYSIIGANRADHSRFRRLLSHAFSDKGIREQNLLIRQYVDLLIQRLHEHAGTRSQDMVDWYTWTLFDVIGDLAFGEPFDCLKDAATHPWIESVFGNIKAAPVINVFHRYSLSSLIGMLAPKKLLQLRKENYEYSVAKIDQRLESESERLDFWDKVLIHNKEGKGTGMTRDEMVSNASLLVLAGSETTATLLSGATYLLLKHPDVMAKLVTEIRTAFKSDSEIDLLTVSKLEYMLAVLDETMRLYPPVTSQPNRVTPRGGEMVCGKWVAEGVRLTVETTFLYSIHTNTLLDNRCNAAIRLLPPRSELSSSR
jgi:averantin hydroxylase